MRIGRTHWLLLLLAITVTIGLSREAVSAPRILITESRLERIRKGLKDAESHYALAFGALQQRVEAEDLEAFGATDSNLNYARSYLAQAAAFCYQVTGEQEYAQIAYRTLRAVHENPGPDKRLPESGNHGLSRATVGLGFALAYDWCGEAWTESQREEIRDKVERALEMWKGFRHANLGHQRKSNWVGVCRGAELMMILGIGQEEQRAQRYQMLQDELMKHLTNGFDAIGATQEGSGYMGYGGIFLLPAAIAAHDVGDTALWDKLHKDRHFYRKMMYAGSFASVPADGVLAGRKVFPASGVGGPNINDEGFASLVLATVPEDDLPEALWWYDRHMGRLAEPRDEPERHFEPYRQGTMWALLFHPDDVEAEDPTGEWDPVVTGDQGRHYFRNRWQDADDILFAVHADSKWLRNAWTQSEAGMFSLVAYDKYFIGGPRRERDGQWYSKLLVDGKAGNSRLTGRSERLATFDRGGYVVIDGGEQYRNLGLDRYRRHVLVQYGPPSDNDAVIVIADQVESSKEHTYTWNAVLGTEARLGDWNLKVETGEEAGYPTFTIRGDKPGVVKGWVLAPDDANVRTDGQRLHFDQEASDTHILVALSVEPETPAALKVTGKGPNGVIFRVGDTLIGYDRANHVLNRGDKARNINVRHER